MASNAQRPQFQSHATDNRVRSVNDLLTRSPRVFEDLIDQATAVLQKEICACG